MKKYIISLILLFISFLSVTNAQQTKIDSLESLLKTNLPDTTKIDVFNDLGKQYSGKDTTKELNYFKKALKLAQKTDFKLKIADCYFELGRFYRRQNNNSKAMSYFEKHLKINMEIDFKEGMAESYRQIGLIHYSLGKYNDALGYYFKDLRINEATNDQWRVAGSYINIGVLYGRINNNRKALDYYLKSIEIYTKINKKERIALCYNNIGGAYQKLSEYEKALDYYTKALSIWKQQKNNGLIALSYNGIGELYVILNKFEKAKYYLTESLKMRENLSYENKGELISSYKALGKLHIKMNQSDEAIDYYAKALTLSEELKTLSDKEEIYEGLYNAYKEMNNISKALEYHELYTVVKDSLAANENIEKITQIEEQYKFDKEVEAQKRAEQEALIKEQKHKTRINIIQYSIITIAILFLVILLFFTGRFILKPRTIEIMVFFTIILLFEFLLVVLDPLIDKYSAGSPIFKLTANAILALGIFPLHSLLEENLKLRIIKKKREIIRKNI